MGKPKSLSFFCPCKTVWEISLSQGDVLVQLVDVGTVQDKVLALVPRRKLAQRNEELCSLKRQLESFIDSRFSPSIYVFESF